MCKLFNKNKTFIITLLIVSLITNMFVCSFADDETDAEITEAADENQKGHWEHVDAGYKWVDDNGEELTYGWHWIDTDRDGIEERYFINVDGVKLVSCVTPDGYKVDSDGRWISNGSVQLKYVPSPGVEKTEEVKAKLSSASQIHINHPEEIETVVYEEDDGEFDALVEKIQEKGYDYSEIADMKTVAELNAYLDKKAREIDSENAELESLEIKKDEKIFDQEWLKKYKEYKKKKIEKQKEEFGKEYDENGDLVETTEDPSKEEIKETEAVTTKSRVINTKAPTSSISEIDKLYLFLETIRNASMSNAYRVASDSNAYRIASGSNAYKIASKSNAYQK